MVKELLYALLFVVLTQWHLSLVGQHPYIVPVTPADDYLPTNSFYVFRDNSDVMWIATNSGVYRYDGYAFTHFTSADGLGDNEILRIYQDKKNRIWFQPINGNPSFYLNGSIHNAQNDSLVKQLEFNKMVLAECEDDRGNLYLAGRGPVVYKINDRDEVSQISVSGLENFIWVAKDGSLKMMDKASFPTKIIRADTYGSMHLISNEQDVYSLKDDNILEKEFTLPQGSAEIIFIKFINYEEVFIGTRNGLFIWNRITKDYKYLMPGYSVSSAERDFEGNTWISTLQSGVYLMPNVNVSFWNSDYGLSEDKITALEADADGRLWIGCANNHYAIMENGKIIADRRLPEPTPMDIMNIRHFGDRTYVVGKAGILGMGKGFNKSYGVYANDLIFYNDMVMIGQDNAMLFTRDEFETRIKQLVFNYPERKRDYEVINARTNVFCQINNAIWIGTSRGLYIYENGKTSFVGDHIAACKNPIRDILFDSRTGLQFVGTMNGLLVLRDEQLVTIIDKNSGLPNSDCNAIFLDKEGIIWAAFGNQLVAITKNGENFTTINYTKALRLDPSRITDVHVAQGKVFISTESGLIAFDQNIELPNPVPPRIIISSFQVNGKESELGKDVRLHWKQNDITVQYSGMSFTSKNRITYTYYLSGYDTKWHNTTDRSIQLKSLPPGDYKFLVKATNIAGISSPVSTISFSINKPVWGEVWFIILSVCALAGIILIGWRMRLRAVKQSFTVKQRTIQLEMEHAEAERKIEQLNQQVFRQQMNPHFIFNALNTIKGYYAENDIKKASDYISKFSKLLRNILENNEQWIPIEREINAITLYLDLAAMRYAYKFTYNISAHQPLQVMRTGIPPMLLQPFIENALVHGIAPKQGSGHIAIDFSVSNNKLICIVEDDGIGRKASATRSRISEHNSKATQIINDYLQALNQRERAEAFILDIDDLTDETGKGIGTRIRLSMPLIILNP